MNLSQVLPWKSPFALIPWQPQNQQNHFLSGQLDETCLCHHLEVDSILATGLLKAGGETGCSRIQASRDPNCPCWNSVHVTVDLCSVKENAGILACLPHGVIVRAALLEIPQPWTCIKCAHVCIRWQAEDLGVNLWCGGCCVFTTMHCIKDSSLPEDFFKADFLKLCNHKPHQQCFF